MVEVFVNREIKISQQVGYMRDSMIVVGGILLILAVSLAFTNFLIDAQVPMKMFSLIQTYIANKIVFLILLNGMLLLLGAILDIFSALVIMVPLIFPELKKVSFLDRLGRRRVENYY